jgi:hypothetical protein
MTNLSSVKLNSMQIAAGGCNKERKPSDVFVPIICKTLKILRRNHAHPIKVRKIMSGRGVHITRAITPGLLDITTS